MTGKAGAGKTACVIEVVEGLRKQCLPVLAFRLDRILSVSTTTDLGDHLGLDESPVLVLMAAAEATGRPGVLIVDQLDAVSTLSGRSSGAFDLVERLLQEARGARARVAIHVVVVCRAFDWKNSLRQLLPDPSVRIDVTEFTTDEVKSILSDDGFDPASFRERQLELMRLPQNLSFFLEADFDTLGTPTFGTAKALFDKYWDAKRQLVADRIAPAPDQWIVVIEILCDEMTVNQQLAVAKEKLDKISPAYLSRMTSEGVLTFDGRHYGVGHESFFDYCFARLFVNRSESLVSFLKGSEQHLFRRAQVRQVLAYLRDADRVRYVQELAGLLSDGGIRTHLKDLAFALLAEVADPDEKEWEIWRQWIAPALKAIEDDAPNPDRLSEIAWRWFFGSPSWFAYADERGMVEGWLASGNDRLVDRAENYLWLHKRRFPDRVAALLEPYADRADAWPQRLRSVMAWVDQHTSRPFFDLFLRLVDNGTFDEAGGQIATNSTFWNRIDGPDETHPEWVAEVLAHRLRRRFKILRDVGERLNRRNLIGYDRSAAEIFSGSAERAPAEFVRHVLPVVLQISDAALTDDKPPKRDSVWPVPIKTEHPGGEDACLAGLVGALAALAREGAADLRNVIADLRRRDTHVANHLLLALYAGGTARYADEAVLLWCEEPWRFECGFSDSPHWCAMEAIRAVVPHCTAENREKMETVILGYVSPFERTRYGYRENGGTRFALLSAIPSDLRSARVNAHFGELERKFGTPPHDPREIIAGWVKSPIEEDAAVRMTDDHWLGAIAKYSSSERPWRNDFKGGAEQLAQVLGARVKEEPERFARLGLRFPADADPVYLIRTLAALRETPIATDLKLQVCRKALEESCGPCGGSMADLLGSIEDPLPEDAVRMLHRLATEHEDPASETWKKDAGGGKPYYDGDPYFHGINTARGRAAGAMQNLILTDAVYVDKFRPTLERMIQAPGAAVRSCVAATLRAVAWRDPSLGMSLFLKMDLSEDRLLATDPVYRFILDALRDHFAEVEPVVKRMLRSPEPDVREAGARLASLTTLHGQSAADLVDEAFRGDARHRLGVAQVASANIDVREYRKWSKAMLARFFNDEDADVRREAASCFRQVESETLETFGDLIATFCDSKAFQDDSFFILHALEESRGRLPGTTCDVCERFLDRFADEARDIRTGRAGDAHTVTKLVFRTYHQHQDDEWPCRSLDLIDRLCLEGSHEAQSEFEQFER